MQFTKATSNENFPKGRWISENNVWEIGFLPVLYGVRVRLGKVGSACVDLDYCAGDNLGFALILLVTVINILEALPESITAQQIEKLFPMYEVKPIDRDPYCWRRLQELAKLSPEEIQKLI